MSSTDTTFGEQPFGAPMPQSPAPEPGPVWDEPTPPTRAQLRDAAATAGPSESARYAMFVILIIVMASAPTWVAFRAIREGRTDDFPLGGTLGTTAIFLFAVAALALLSVCFWPSLNAAVWTAPTTGTLIGASGVTMAFLGGTHAVAGLIGTGFLSEPVWLAWLVLISVYPIAGQVALRLVKDFIGPNALDPDALDEREPDDEFWTREQSPFVGARSFGAAPPPEASLSPVDPRQQRRDLAAAAQAAIDEGMDPAGASAQPVALGPAGAPGPAEAAGPAGAPVRAEALFEHVADDRANEHHVTRYGDEAQYAGAGFDEPMYEDDGYDDDPFADPSERPTSAGTGANAQQWSDDQGWVDGGDWDDDDWDDDPFA